MQPKIEKIDAFYVVGHAKQFGYTNSFEQVPAFWGEYFQKGYAQTVCPCYGICFDDGSPDTFTYMIGDNCLPTDEPGPGFEKRLVPAYTWAKFTALGAIPESIQKANTVAYREWLPNNGVYELAAGMNIEMYTAGDTSAADYVTELWIPVKKRGE